MLVNIFLYRFEKGLISEKNSLELKYKIRIRNSCETRVIINKSKGEKYWQKLNLMI